MIQGLVGLLALVLGELPAEAQPGPYQVGSMTLEIVDEARKNRLLRTEVWYPTEDEDGTPASNYLTGVPSRALREASVAEGKWPIIVFSHGLGGVRETMTFLCEHLASHGYIVASSDHPYTTRYDVNPLRLYESALDRPKDVRRVLDELSSRSQRTDDRLVGRVDTDRIGVVGCSFGAYTVLATAGAWVDYSSHPERKHKADAPTHLDLSDARVRAVVAIVPPCRPTFDEEGLARLTKPLLILGGSEDSLTPFDTCQRPIFDWTRGERTLVRIAGANHLSFQDDEILAIIPESIKRMNRMNENSIRPERLEPIVNRLVLRFFNQHVRGLSNTEPLDATSDPELEIEYAPPQNP